MRVLLAHGSSDSEHGEQVQDLANKVSVLLDEEVGTAFLSDGIIPEGSQVLPLFLGKGKHVTDDIPKLIAASKSCLLPSLGEHSEAIARLACAPKKPRLLFALYQMEAFDSLVSALRAGNETCTIALLHGKPSITSVLDHWHNEGLTEVAVQPMLLFGGRSLARVRTMISDSAMPNVTIAPVLSELDGFAELVAECLRIEP